MTDNNFKAEFIGVAEASRRFSLSKSWLYQLTANGELPCYAVSTRKVLLRVEDIQNFIESKARRHNRSSKGDI